MVTWREFAGAAPEIASEGRRLIDASDDGKVLLATVRGDDLPRIHPITMAIVDDRLYAFIIARSPKKLDLELDGRYALHTHLVGSPDRSRSARSRSARGRAGRARTGRGRLGVRGRRRLHLVRVLDRARAARDPGDGQRLAARLHHVARPGFLRIAAIAVTSGGRAPGA